LEELDAVLGFLRRLEGQVEQIFVWMGRLDEYADAGRELFAPILDRAHSAQVLADRVESLARRLPGRVRSALTGLVARLRVLPAPHPGTPPWIVEQVIRASPHSDIAQRVRTLDQVTEQNAAALATAHSAAETAQVVTQQVLQDLSPEVDAQTAITAARELAVRARYTPSTRAAIQLVVEAIAAQIDQQSHTAVSVVGRQTAAIQQQTLLSQQLAVVVDRLVAVSEQQNAQEKEWFARRAAAAASMVESQRQTFSEITQGLLALNSMQRQQAMDQFFDTLTGRP
jgi:hypothetical protein